MTERSHASSFEHDRPDQDLERMQPSTTPLQRRTIRGTGMPATGGSLVGSASRLAVQMFADAVGAGLYAGQVQLDGTGGYLTNDAVHRAAAHGVSGSGGTLPHLGAIQKAFGRHDVSSVQAHVGGKAAEGSAAMGARAYAAGDQVAFASSPDLHLAAHEAAHVVQQRGGVQLSGGVGAAGDVYEQHADAVADSVTRGDSAEALLDQHAPSAGASGGVQRAVQMDRPAAAAHARATHGTAPAAVVVAPTDRMALLRYASSVHSHLHDPPTSLVPYARSLDQQLLAGVFDSRGADVIIVVDALLAIRGSLASREPSELAAFRTSSSPLDGMVEDITPFGNVDLWHASRSAAVARQAAERRPRAEHAPAREPSAGPATSTASAPEHTIGELGGAVSARQAGTDLATQITAPHEGSAGALGNVIDGASMAYDGIDALIGVGGFFGEVLAPVLQPILSTITLLLTMEDAWRSTTEGRAAAGMRMAVVALDGSWTPYPDQMTTTLLESHVDGTDAYRMEVGSVGYETGGRGENASLIRVGIARVSGRVNQAVRRAEAWPAIRDAIVRANPALADQIRQDLRRTMYHRIVDSVRAQLGPDGAGGH